MAAVLFTMFALLSLIKSSNSQLDHDNFESLQTTQLLLNANSDINTSDDKAYHIIMMIALPLCLCVILNKCGSQILNRYKVKENNTDCMICHQMDENDLERKLSQTFDECEPINDDEKTIIIHDSDEYKQEPEEEEEENENITRHKRIKSVIKYTVTINEHDMTRLDSNDSDNQKMEKMFNNLRETDDDSDNDKHHYGDD
eukprot:152334_1